MNRRSFLRNLIVGFTAAVTAPARRTLESLAAVTEAEAAPQLLTSYWFQTSRMTVYCSPAYLEALDRILAGRDPKEIIAGFNVR